MDEKQRIEQLRRELHDHNYKYYVLNQPTISDYDFDQLMHELQDLESRHPEMADPNSPTQRVGSDIQSEFRQVAHKYPMLSLANTYSEQDVRDWYDSVTKGLAGEPFEVCCEMKYDGLSISLTYVDGRLTQAVTRGDGVQGDDVTANVRTIRAIPLVLPGTGYPPEFEIRGEILMPWASFERLNAEREAAEEPLFANPRNAASGTLDRYLRSFVVPRLSTLPSSTSSFNNCLVLGPFNPMIPAMASVVYSLPSSIIVRICVCRLFRATITSADSLF